MISYFSKFYFQSPIKRFKVLRSQESWLLGLLESWVPGPESQVLGSGYQVRGSQVIESWILGTGSWGAGSWVLSPRSIVPDSRVPVPGSRVLGSGFLDSGSWVLDLKSSVPGPGSWVLILHYALLPTYCSWQIQHCSK